MSDKRIWIWLAAALMSAAVLTAQPTPIPFDEAHWQLANARVVEHLGRPALMGLAALKDVTIENGVIEYDLAVSGARSYPGVVFRSQPDGSWERFYIRPHRAGRTNTSLYSDVLQYLPAWNRVDSWQLYSGPGYTAGSVIPIGRWFHVKIEVNGDQARVFVDNAPAPGLEIPLLRHGRRRGGIMLMGPADGSAYFSNFSVDTSGAPAFTLARPPAPAPGFVRSWQVSQAVPTLEIDDRGSAPPAAAANPQWRDLPADEYGLVDVARIQGRTGRPDTVFLRTVISSARAEVHPYRFGYSDSVTIYLNGVKMFSGDSTYQGRDPSFLGIVGPNDALYLPLRAGENELLVALGEMQGGWGFLLQDALAEYRAPGVAFAWETAKRFSLPESAAYDAKRRAVYVSNFDPFTPNGAEGRQTIARIDPAGGEPQVLARGLRNPTGLIVYKDTLYAVEAKAVVEIALPAGDIVRRIEVADAEQMNDIAVDSAGVLYVTDPPQGTIRRIQAGKVEIFLQGADVGRPNGVCVGGKRLVWADNIDQTLKAVDLPGKTITTVAALPGGILDGVVDARDGGWLVSHNEGRLFHVCADGAVTLLLDRSVTGGNIADFTFIPESATVVYPTFLDNRVAAETLPRASDEKVTRR